MSSCAAALIYQITLDIWPWMKNRSLSTKESSTQAFLKSPKSIISGLLADHLAFDHLIDYFRVASYDLVICCWFVWHTQLEYSYVDLFRMMWGLAVEISLEKAHKLLCQAGTGSLAAFWFSWFLIWKDKNKHTGTYSRGLLCSVCCQSGFLSFELLWNITRLLN